MNIQKLAEIYRRSVHDAALVAEICDEVIDRSGALLDYVREEAYALREEAAQHGVEPTVDIGDGLQAHPAVLAMILPDDE